MLRRLGVASCRGEASVGDMPPTGKEITITFLNLDRFADGKLVEQRAEADMLGLLQQLGAMPSLATA